MTSGPLAVLNNEKEVEEWGDLNPGNYFVTPDFRIYKKASWMDDALWYHFDADTVENIESLSTYLNMAEDGFNEMPFEDILLHAQELDKAYKTALDAIRKCGWKKWEKRKPVSAVLGAG